MRRNSLARKREENMMNWVGYWRKNPQRFASEYLGLNLHLYQTIMLYMMNKVSYFMYIAARGAGKSFIIAVYCVIRCILYPNTNIVVSSGTKGQARLIISEKIVFLYNNFEGVRAEIGDKKNIKTGMNETEVLFLNGSKISAQTSSDNSRGLRCNILIMDEFRLIKKDIIDEVLKPMLNVVRQPPFMSKPEYADYPQEENKQIYISSAWYKTHWMWKEFQSFVQSMLKDKDYFAVDTPYQLSLHHKLLSKAVVDAERTSATFDKTRWDMEYEALFVGENDRGYFKLEDINNCRTISKAFMPPTAQEFIENNRRSSPKKLSNIPRIDKDSEIRLVCLDVALMGGNKNVKNDSSAFTCIRLIQEGASYRRDVLYLESIVKTISTDDLAIRLKQLYHDFEADYVVLDAMGNGLGVFDAVCKILYDEERDVEYPAWSASPDASNHEEMNERNKTTGLPVVIPYKADARLNHEMAVGLRTALENKKIRFPINDIEQREFLVDKGGFLAKSIEQQQRELYAFQQASALSNELIALEYEVRSGYIKIKEVGTATKDRYSSLAYGNIYASELEKKLIDNDDNDMYKDMIFVTSYVRED